MHFEANIAVQSFSLNQNQSLHYFTCHMKVKKMLLISVIFEIERIQEALIKSGKKRCKSSSHFVYLGYINGINNTLIFVNAFFV